MLRQARPAPATENGTCYRAVKEECPTMQGVALMFRARSVQQFNESAKSECHAAQIRGNFAAPAEWSRRCER